MTARWRLLRVAVALVAALAVCATFQGSAAQPAPKTSSTHDAATTWRGAAALKALANGGVYGIPSLPNDTIGNVEAWGAHTVGTATSTRSKVSVSLPVTQLLAYLSVCVALPMPKGTPTIQTCCPDKYVKPCAVTFPSSSLDSTGSVAWDRFTGRAWVASPRGSTKRYGTFAAVHVHALAFGSVPVSATVHLAQVTSRSGLYEPFSFFYQTETPEFPIGARVSGYGRAPKSPFADAGSFVYLPTVLTGSVTIRISDVTVDREPVNLGAHCATTSPGTLELGSPGGFSGQPADDTPISAYYGRPGSFTTNPGSQLYGTLSIPRFSGCGVGDDDLSPLLTSLISASDNPVTTTLTDTLNQCTPDICPPYPLEATSSAATAAAKAVTQPAVVTRLASAFRRLAPSLRRAALRSLPDSVSQRVAAELARR